MAKYIADNIFRTYDVASATKTGANVVLDFALEQVFRIPVAQETTIVFDNVPGGSRALTAVLHLYDASLPSRVINWPADIVWNRGIAPQFSGTSAVVVLLWTGEQWLGSVGVDND